MPDASGQHWYLGTQYAVSIIHVFQNWTLHTANEVAGCKITGKMVAKCKTVL